MRVSVDNRNDPIGVDLSIEFTRFLGSLRNKFSVSHECPRSGARLDRCGP